MEVNVAYSSSDAYAKYTGISILSLFHNNKDINEINVYLFSTDISEENRNNIYTIGQMYKRNIVIIDINKQMEQIVKQFNLEVMRGGYNTYVRLFCNAWLEHLDRILFIDSDTLVTGSVSDLYSTEMGDTLIAAVPDLGIYGRYTCGDDIEIVNKCEKYINAGIMLINLKQWRDENASDYVAHRILEYKKDWCNQEQSIFNYAFNKSKYVHLKYNYYTAFHYEEFSHINTQYDIDRIFTREEYEEAKNAPVIIHFVGSHYDRPWYLKSVSPFKAIYMDYYNNSPWKDMPLEAFPKNPQIGYRIYDYILYIMRKYECHKLYYYFRIVLGQKLKKYLIGIMGNRT